MRFNAINISRTYSETKISSLRKKINNALGASPYADKITVVTTGSYARREASAESDLDLYILFDSDKSPEALSEELKSLASIYSKEISKSAGSSGTFGTEVVVKFNDMLSNIGGAGDTNASLTRRMLLLLEGEWLFGEERFADYRNLLISKYLSQSDPANKVPRFLLNDVIRYYRTITTDFQHKVAEGNKTWGLRNIKLRFSRKILYFSGLIAAAELTKTAPQEREKALSQLLDLPPLDRIKNIGEKHSQTDEIFELYDYFLDILSDGQKRETLEALDRDKRDACPLFVDLKKKGRELDTALESWLLVNYLDQDDGSPHPIHNALLF